MVGGYPADRLIRLKVRGLKPKKLIGDLREPFGILLLPDNCKLLGQVLNLVERGISPLRTIAETLDDLRPPVAPSAGSGLSRNRGRYRLVGLEEAVPPVPPPTDG